MALTAIHLNQVTATATKTLGIERRTRARTVVVGLLVGTAMFVAAPFVVHAATVRPPTNAQLTSIVTSGSSQFPVVVTTGSTTSQNGLASIGTLAP